MIILPICTLPIRFHEIYAAHVPITFQRLMVPTASNLNLNAGYTPSLGREGWACNLMVSLQIGRIIIEFPLPGKCRSILNSTSLFRDLRFHETSKPKLIHQRKQKCAKRLLTNTINRSQPIYYKVLERSHYSVKIAS